MKKMEFLEKKIKLPDCKVIEEVNKLGLKKYRLRKGDMILDRL